MADPATVGVTSGRVGSASPRTTGRPTIAPTRRLPLSLFGFLPFVAYVLAFFGLPCGLVLVSAFERTDPATQVAGPSLQNWADSLSGVYRTGLLNSLQLAAVTSLTATVLGLVLAWQIASTRSGALREAVSTSSAVLANFGGLPLAFLFVAVLGSAGVLTKTIEAWSGVRLQQDLHFSLFTLPGVELVYLYFLIPLMVLVITPALEGVRPPVARGRHGSRPPLALLEARGAPDAAAQPVRVGAAALLRFALGVRHRLRAHQRDARHHSAPDWRPSRGTSWSGRTTSPPPWPST